MLYLQLPQNTDTFMLRTLSIQQYVCIPVRMATRPLNNMATNKFKLSCIKVRNQ